MQGQEADAVLISLVRSNQHGVVGFLSDFRRLNVAVTRARKHVMIVGDASTISKDCRGKNGGFEKKGSQEWHCSLVVLGRHIMLT